MMKIFRQILISFLLTAVWAGDTFGQDSTSVDHHFSTYSVVVTPTADRPELQMSEDAYRFRTRIRQAYTGEVNFAGKYILVGWGCGTSCQSYGIIDTETGHARLLSLVTSLGVRYQRDSRLLIADPASYVGEDLSERPEYALPKYYEFVQDSLQEIPYSDLKSIQK